MLVPMGRRRRIEFYFAVAFTAAAASYLNHAAADPLARPERGSFEYHANDVVFFLDAVFDHYGPTAGGKARRVVNVLSAGCWGIAVGFVLSVLLIDADNRWRLLARHDAPPPPDPDADHGT